MAGRYTSFEQFWPFYLHEHSDATNRRLHFAGTNLVNAVIIAAFAQGKPMLLLLCPLFGYGFAWFGHFIVERNRPATFQYPLWSLRGDYKLYFLMLRGQLWHGKPDVQVVDPA